MDILLLIRVILYYCIVLLGLMISIPTGITQARFHNECPLYGSVRGNIFIIFVTQLGARSNCEFATYFHLLISILVAAALAALHTYALVSSFRGSPFQLLEFFLLKLVLLVSHGVAALISLVSAFILSVGLGSLCNSITSLKSIQRCSDSQKARWFGGDGSSVYTSLALAAGANWICFICWTAQAVILAVTLLKNENVPNAIT